jgi:hypothetical protein
MPRHAADAIRPPRSEQHDPPPSPSNANVGRSIDWQQQLAAPFSVFSIRLGPDALPRLKASSPFGDPPGASIAAVFGAASLKGPLGGVAVVPFDVPATLLDRARRRLLSLKILKTRPQHCSADQVNFQPHEFLMITP